MSLIGASINDIPRFGLSFFANYALANGVTNIIPVPGASNAGFVLRSMNCFAGASGSLALFIGLAAPLNNGDATKQRIYATDQTAFQNVVNWNMRIPPSFGLWVSTSVVSCGICLGYDTL